MAGWTDKTAKAELQRLIKVTDTLQNQSRTSENWVRWRMNVLSILEEVFGKQSRAHRSFAALSWEKRSFIIDPDDYLLDGDYQRQGMDAIIERKHSEEAVRQLGVAKGILQGALDDLIRKGISGAFVSQADGGEASALLKIINLVERQWRKTVREVPSREREVQDAFENLLIGSQINYGREAESIPFSSKKYVPDFTVAQLDLAIDIKLCASADREKQMLAELNDDIAAYKKRYKNVFFAVYDCGYIRDVDRFKDDFEKVEGVIVRVVKH